MQPSTEAEDLRGHLRKFLATAAGRDQLRARIETDTGFDRSLWRRAVDELGLTSLATPVAADGSDVDLVTLGVVFEELGRALVCAPFLSTVGLATHALRTACAEDAALPLLESVGGGAVATLAWTGGRPGASDLVLDGRTLTGSAPSVLDGADADVLLVAAQGGDLCLVDTDARGLVRTPLPALDTTRRIARVDLDATPCQVLARDAAAALDHAYDVTVLLHAAEALGGMGRCLDLAVEHARTRIQFARPIGSFQAIKHRCADLLVDVELARSLVYNALATVDSEPAAAAREAALVRSFVPDAFVAAAGAALQIHGGTGFTWEHDVHLYLKRAKAGQVLFTSPTAARRAAAALVGVR